MSTAPDTPDPEQISSCPAEDFIRVCSQRRGPARWQWRLQGQGGLAGKVGPCHAPRLRRDHRASRQPDSIPSVDVNARFGAVVNFSFSSADAKPVSRSWLVPFQPFRSHAIHRRAACPIKRIDHFARHHAQFDDKPGDVWVHERGQRPHRCADRRPTFRRCGAADVARGVRQSVALGMRPRPEPLSVCTPIIPAEPVVSTAAAHVGITAAVAVIAQIGIGDAIGIRDAIPHSL